MATSCLDFPSLADQVTLKKGSEILIVEYCSNLAIVLTFAGAAPQVLRFTDATTAVFFQTDLERELLRAGWSFDYSDPNPFRDAVNAFEISGRLITSLQ